MLIWLVLFLANATLFWAVFSALILAVFSLCVWRAYNRASPNSGSVTLNEHEIDIHSQSSSVTGYLQPSSRVYSGLLMLRIKSVYTGKKQWVVFHQKAMQPEQFRLFAQAVSMQLSEGEPQV